jgi:hypothetical protein
LPDGNHGQDMVHQIGRTLVHAPTHATGAETPSQPLHSTILFPLGNEAPHYIRWEAW